jgi:multiple sugar transport system ATP-binding protein
VRVPVPLSGERKNIVLGIRPEDLSVAADSAGGQIHGRVFSVELTGDSALLTVMVDETLVTVRVDKDFTAAVDAPVALAVVPGRSFLFDAASEQRLRA